MKDLSFFVCFILIFLFGFSITSWSLMMTPKQVKWNYDDHGVLVNTTISDDASLQWGWRLLRDVTDYGIWKVFGQVETIGKRARVLTTQWSNAVIVRLSLEGNDFYSGVAFVLAILFVTVSNVLLLNVLVALFK
jgi:hypothetical protein